MRCPDCSQRNSVAARKCQFCGTRFKRKSANVPVKLIGGIVGVGLVCGVAFAVVPLFHPSEVDLSNLGKQMARGPKSPEEAKQMNEQLEASLVKYLQKNGNLPSGDLLTKLQSELPTSAFEVLVFDLAKKVRLIEVDCVMEPSYYLVVPTEAGPKPVKISGLKVFDEARTIEEPKKDYVILLGHTLDPVREPQIRAIAVSPEGDVNDETDKVLPLIRGEGKASFKGKTSGLDIKRTVLAASKSELLFKGDPGLKDEPIETDLKWNNGKYEVTQDLNSGKLSALYSVAHALVAPGEADDFKSRIAPDVRETIKKLSGPLPQPAEFTIASSSDQSSGKGKRAKSLSQYVLASQGRTFEISLSSAGKGSAWSVTGLSEKGGSVAVEDASKSEKLSQEPSNDGSQSAPAEVPVVVQESKQAIEETKSSNDESQSQTRSKPTKVASLSSRDNTESADEDHINKDRKNRNDRESRSKSRDDDKRDRREERVAKAENQSGNSRKSRESESKNSRDSRNERDSDRRTRDKDRKQTIASQPVKSPEPAEQAAPGANEEPASGTAKVNLSTGRVSVRSGPGTKFATITQTRKDSELKIIGKEDGWYKVLVNGKKGYIYGGFVDYGKGDGYTTAVVKKKKSVHDEGHKSVHTPQPGDKLVILDGLKNDKYKVRLSNGKTGYVDKDAIDVAVDEPEFVP